MAISKVFDGDIWWDIVFRRDLIEIWRDSWDLLGIYMDSMGFNNGILEGKHTKRGEKPVESNSMQ